MNVKSKKQTKYEQAQQLKAQGYANKEIKEIVFSDQTPASQAVSLSKALKNTSVHPLVENALEANNIDLVDLVAQYKEELTAVKRVYFKGDFVEEVPDYTARQKARDALLKLYQAYLPFAPTTPPLPPTGSDDSKQQVNEALIKAIKQGDIEAIERIVFKKVM